MSLSAAANNALSGLRMASLTTRLISDNIANALTPGYGVRSMQLTSDHNSTGVRILDVARHSDPVLLANRRLADAEAGAANDMARFLSRTEDLIGLPGDPASLSARVAQFGTDLLAAASRPDSDLRLDAAVTSAASVVQAVNDAAKGVQNLRSQADSDIAGQVDRLNDLLQRVDDLNARIVETKISGSSAAPLVDQRQVLIDEVATMVPLREVPRENGKVALFTNGGAIILDQDPAVFGFTPVNLTTPYMSIGAGSLSGLTLNGNPVSTDPQTGPLRGGTLSSAFEIRDVTAVEMQGRLDAFARDLIERFEDPQIDGTRLAGDPGLFTDGGGPFDPLAVTGLAQRLELNAAIDPNAGGATWRLRDGLGAAAPGNVGDAGLLRDLSDALDAGRSAPAGLGSGTHSVSSLAGQLTSMFSTDRANAELDQSYSSAQQSEMQALEGAEGVDTDAELQALMIIEQIYAANAQVMQAVDDMLAELMRI
ncbi:MAG: flagellar hook-associated protein FlgK [Ruegeria sp.]